MPNSQVRMLKFHSISFVVLEVLLNKIMQHLVNLQDLGQFSGNEMICWCLRSKHVRKLWQYGKILLHISFPDDWISSLCWLWFLLQAMYLSCNNISQKLCFFKKRVFLRMLIKLSYDIRQCAKNEIMKSIIL